MKRKKQHVELAERGAAALDKAVTTVTPYVEQAQAYAAGALTPALDEAKVGIAAARNTVTDTVLPRINDMVHDAADAPATKETVRRSRTAAAALRGDIEVSDRTLNKISKRRAKQAAKRNKAIAGELLAAKKAVLDEVDNAKKSVNKSKRKEKKGKIGKVLLIVTVLGAVAVVVKQLLAAKKDDPWQSYEPSTFSGPTSAPTTPSATPTAGGPAAEAPVDDTLAAAAATEAVGEPVDPVGPAAAPATEPVVPADPTETLADVDAVDEDADLPVVEDTTTADDGSAKYGPGSFVGVEPPEGFTIKGNDRSMKYHVAGTDSYDRTIADVWFNSTMAAEAAGFTEAHR